MVCFIGQRCLIVTLALQYAKQESTIVEEVRSFWKQEQKRPGGPRCEFIHVDGRKLSNRRLLDEELRGREVFIPSLMQERLADQHQGYKSANGYFKGPAYTSSDQFKADFGEYEIISNPGTYKESSPRVKSTVHGYFKLPTSDRHVFFQKSANLYSSDWKNRINNEIWQQHERSLPEFLEHFNEQRFLTVGTLASRTNFHNEHDESWMLLMAGAKAWWIAPESATQGKDVIRDHLDAWGVDPCTLLRHNKKAPKLPAPVKFCIQRPGQIVYFGNRQPHATCNLEDFVLGIGGQGYIGKWPPLARAVHRADLVAIQRQATGSVPETLENVLHTGRYSGQRALERAIEVGNASSVNALLNRRASLLRTKSDGPRPLVLAAQTGHVTLVKLLLDHRADARGLKKPKTGDQAPMHVAADSGHKSLINLFVSLRAEVSVVDRTNGAQPLHLAATNGHGGVVETLMRHRASIKVPDSRLAQPLHYATQEGHLPVVVALISSRASPSAKAEQGMQPIHTAARDGRVGLTETLIKLSANLGAMDDHGKQVVHHAAEEGRVALIDFAIRHGADLRVSDRQGFQPLHSAARSGHATVVRRFLEHRMDVAAVEKAGGGQPMHLVAMNGEPHLISLLATHAADLEARDHRGSRPVHHATAHGHIAALKALAQRRAELTPTDNQGAQPAHIAASIGHVSVIKFLINRRISMTNPDNRGLKPNEVAARQGHTAVVRLLDSAARQAKPTHVHREL